MRIATIVALLLTSCLLSPRTATAAQLAGFTIVPGDATDFFPGVGLNQNRLGGFNSALHYDAARDLYYGLVDRGPGGGVVSYETRVQEFRLNVDANTGAIGGFQLQSTIPFRTADGSAPFNGLQPRRLHGDSFTLGLSFDPEGLAVAPNGNLFVADEYGPAVYEFARVDVGGQIEARFVRSFATPDRLLPRDANGAVNYDALRVPTPPDPAQVSGRQESRGFEGLAFAPDASKLYAFIQGPLAEEGASNEGRRSRNARIVEFDVASGMPTRQFIYQLTDRALVNPVIDLTNPDPAADISGTGQGRNLVISDAIAVSDHQFLVTERENRGFGSDNPALTDPILSAVGLKAIYLVDINGATDVSGISLLGANALTTPALAGNPDPSITIVPVTKTLAVDIFAELRGAGLPIPEKIEGLTIGPRLSSGNHALIVGSDNDFSVTQTEIGVGAARHSEQFEIFTFGNVTRYSPLDNPNVTYLNVTNANDAATYLVDQGPLPNGFAPMPSYLYSFDVVVPEPSCLSMAFAALGCVVGTRWSRRRRSHGRHSSRL